MGENVENIMLEHLKKIQAEISGLRGETRDVKARLANIEGMIARQGRDNAHAYAEQIEDRHAVDRLAERVLRIERRLELND